VSPQLGSSVYETPVSPHRGFFVTAFEFALSAVAAGPQLSDRNGSPIERFLIPAN
jgi:hypothetical protein